MDSAQSESPMPFPLSQSVEEVERVEINPTIHEELIVFLEDVPSAGLWVLFSSKSWDKMYTLDYPVELDDLRVWLTTPR